MPAPAAAIANFFLDIAQGKQDKVSPLRLQKLVYFAHGWHLGLTGEPLIREPIEAWKHGPVVSSLYHEFKNFGNTTIDCPATEFDCEKLELSIPSIAGDERLKAFLTRIWEIYSKFSPGQLSFMSHEEGGPWHTIMQAMGANFQLATIIPNDLIKEHFATRLANKST